MYDMYTYSSTLKVLSELYTIMICTRALDKCPGVHPIGVGESTAKILLLVPGAEAKEACGIDQLCAPGLEAGIEGGIYAMQALWDLHEMEENWGFLLIDATSAFNEQNCWIKMLWVVRHKCPSGARFVFNCYKH
jgi:hypothetical protein